MKGAALFIAGVLVGAILLSPTAAQDARARNLNHVGLVVPDYDKALAYYTGTLGFREAYPIRRADGSVQLTYLQLNRNNDPNGAQIEIMQFGADSLQRKAIDAWK